MITGALGSSPRGGHGLPNTVATGVLSPPFVGAEAWWSGSLARWEFRSAAQRRRQSDAVAEEVEHQIGALREGRLLRAEVSMFRGRRRGPASVGMARFPVHPEPPAAIRPQAADTCGGIP